MSNAVFDYEEVHAQIDTKYDWYEQNKLFSPEQIIEMDGWIERQKINLEEIEIDTSPPIVYRNQLNNEQKFAFDILNEFHLKNKQCLMIINGEAGCGKTFTINAICTHLGRLVKRAAPTAKAAFLIRGETLHALLAIGQIAKEYKSIKKQILRNIQAIFQDIRYIIIDEYSMLSQTMLSYIDFRLREIYQKHSLLFGGISIILTGKLKI